MWVSLALHAQGNIMIEINIPKKLRKALDREASDAKQTLHAHIIKKLEKVTPPIEYIDKSILEKGLPSLVAFLNSVPSVSVVSSEITSDAYWWIKLNIDISHHLAWHVVQEFGFIFNYISIQEPLPTIFKPVSPPPYMNGGPDEFLSWVIESTFNYIDPLWIKETLEDRMPNPVTDIKQWNTYE